jgi:TldD protein
VWRTPLERDPFDVPIGEKTEYLLALWRDARVVPSVKYGNGAFESLGEWKLFACTEGSLIEQSITRLSTGFTATAVDAATGEFESVHDETLAQAGWEHVLGYPLRKEARLLAEKAAEKLKSPSVTPGKRDVVIAPSNLWLTIHESVGHPTELDRALGYEANMAGTSFATTDKLGKLKYASDAVTIYADKTTPGALATCGYDDDGVKTQRWDLVKNGLFVGYQTTRDQARWIGEKESRGTSYAQDYRSFPFQRMPNVSLAPDPKLAGKTRSLEDIVGATDAGVLVVGRGSWSIDHQRNNFQFGSQMAYEIKGGKIAHAVRDFAYQSNSVEFWNACDLVGGAESWEMSGALHDGKGEPLQVNAVSHGCPPARFRNVNVLDTNARKGDGAARGA